MSKYIMEFEKGGSFEVFFLEDAAPETVKAFKAALPLEGTCLQARYSGEEFFFNADVAVGMENNVMPYFGAISFNCDPEWQAVCTYYGDSIEMGDDTPFNLFAEIRDDLEELNKVGVRIWTEGGEKITFKEV